MKGPSAFAAAAQGQSTDYGQECQGQVSQHHPTQPSQFSPVIKATTPRLLAALSSAFIEILKDHFFKMLAVRAIVKTVTVLASSILSVPGTVISLYLLSHSSDGSPLVSN